MHDLISKFALAIGLLVLTYPLGGHATVWPFSAQGSGPFTVTVMPLVPTVLQEDQSATGTTPGRKLSSYGQPTQTHHAREASHYIPGCASAPVEPGSMPRLRVAKVVQTYQEVTLDASQGVSQARLPVAAFVDELAAKTHAW